MKLPSLFEQMSTLVGLPSVSCTQSEFDQPNEAVIEQLATWLADIGFRCQVQKVLPGKANLIARLGDGDGGLVLSGHTDTVPFDEDLWSSNPLRLSERNDRWYGLGTCDMKGFFPLAIEAVRRLNPQTMKAPLTILATCDEESSMSGARALVEDGSPLGRAAIIGEPTNLQPIRLHKGVMMERIDILGQSGHSSDPSYGHSALDAMHDAMGALIQLRQTWAKTHLEPAFAVPYPTLNLGCIHGGDNPNRICGHCHLEFDIRPIPGMSVETIRETIDRRLEVISKNHGVQATRTALFPGLLPFEQPIGELTRMAEELTGQAASSVAFGTEAPYLQSLGLETIVLGPGEIACAHQPDEHLALRTIEPTIQVLQGFINRYCVESEYDR
ncbi:MAG: acetylornithine deacetylase [Myxococcota bacterium]|nr:acetylornithine deacetylase [Myxococcota bacterium]